MAINAEQVGVVVVMDRTMVSGLARLAQRHRWSLIHLPTAVEVMQTIGRQRLNIAVVHIAVEPQQAVELIRWLRATRKELLLIAVAAERGEDVERMARLAGVQCYLTQTDDVSLERAISEMLEQMARRSGAAEQAWHPRNDEALSEASDGGLTKLSSRERRTLFPSQAGLHGPTSD